jgi:hypothetical protein
VENVPDRGRVTVTPSSVLAMRPPETPGRIVTLVLVNQSNPLLPIPSRDRQGAVAKDQTEYSTNGTLDIPVKLTNATPTISPETLTPPTIVKEKAEPRTNQTLDIPVVSAPQAPQDQVDDSTPTIAPEATILSRDRRGAVVKEETGPRTNQTLDAPVASAPQVPQATIARETPTPRTIVKDKTEYRTNQTLENPVALVRKAPQRHLDNSTPTAAPQMPAPRAGVKDKTEPRTNQTLDNPVAPVRQALQDDVDIPTPPVAPETLTPRAVVKDKTRTLDNPAAPAPQVPQEYVNDSTRTIASPVPAIQIDRRPSRSASGPPPTSPVVHETNPQAPVILPSLNIPVEADLRSPAVGDDSPAPPAPAHGDTPEPMIVLEPQVNTSAAPQGELAFAARLSTPGAETSAASLKSHPIAEAPAMQRQTAGSSATPIETGTAVERVMRPESMPAPVVAHSQSPAAPRPEAPPVNVPIATRMDHIPEPQAAPAGSPRDITVRIPDDTDRGTDVRFVERGGEVRVSVRTGDTELAQTLRGGLPEFVGRMEHSGIQAEVWSPGSDASPQQNHSQNQFTDQESSGRNHSGSQDREEERREGNKPRWVEELETSIGRENSQATK